MMAATIVIATDMKSAPYGDAANAADNCGNWSVSIVKCDGNKICTYLISFVIVADIHTSDL